MRGEDAPLGRRYCRHLGFRPAIEILQFPGVRGGACAIVRSVGRVAFGECGSDVPDVDDTVLRVEPSMLINLFFDPFAPRRVLVARAERLRSPTGDNFAAAELDAFEQRHEPWFEL